MKKAILFDLDGTVLASKDGIFHAAAYALSHLHLRMPSETDMMAFLGPPLSEGFAKVCCVPDEQIKEAVRLYREYYNNGGMFEAYIFDGIDACLRSLRENGVASYITTSKPQVFAQKILKHFGMDTMFDAVYGSELDGTRGHKWEVVAYCMEKHGLTADDIVLVGDRHFDVLGAKRCGVDCVGVAYGYGSDAELREAGAAYIVQTTQELERLLLTLT